MRLPVPVAAAALIATTALSLAALPVSAPPVSAPPVSAPRVSGLPVAAADGSPAALVGPGHLAGAPTSAVSSAVISGGPSGRGFSWPLAPRPAVHRRFQPPRDRYSRGHRGVDLLSGAGEPVLSAGEGVVAFSGVIAGRGVITVRHSGVLRTSYEPVDGRAPTGMRVHRGTPIGVVSPAPGHCIPLTCLHWGAISGVTYLDPLSLLGLGRPILLPLG